MNMPKNIGTSILTLLLKFFQLIFTVVSQYNCSLHEFHLYVNDNAAPYSRKT